MNYNVFFSPTGTTEKVVRHIGKEFQSAEDIDLSRRDLPNHALNSDDFCIVGVPTFGGRVPAIASERLQKIKGSGTPAFPVVTYGGRAYEDSLKELQYILENNGFRCIAAAAVVARHSIASEIASGRPSREDYEELDSFIEKVKKRLTTETGGIDVPGNIPFKEYNVLPMDVEATDACRKCRICARKCPAGAIPAENPQFTDHEKCISCMRCINVCPFDARKANQVKVDMISGKLKAIYVPGRKNDFF